MKKRRPTAADRELAEYVRDLPFGKHIVDVSPQGRVLLEPEGGMIIHHDDKVITFARSGFVKVKFV